MQNVHDSGSPSPREVVNAPVNLGHVPMSGADLRAQTEAVTGTIPEPLTRDEFGARALQAFEEAITRPAGRPPRRCMRRGSKGTKDWMSRRDLLRKVVRAALRLRDEPGRRRGVRPKRAERGR
jgi:hypothetical protein